MEGALWVLVGVVLLASYLVLKELGAIREELRHLNRQMMTDDGELFQELSLPNKVLRQVSGIRQDLYIGKAKEREERPANQSQEDK